VNPQRIELALRRQRLQLKAAGQRLALREDLNRLRPVFDVADKVHEGYLAVKRHPEWLVGGALVFVVVKPRVVVRWLRRGLSAWQVARQVQQVVAALPASSRKAGR
jgi:hypothetical protein